MAGIDARGDAIYELVAEDASVRRLAGGFDFTEGPVWHPAEQAFYFSDIPADVRYRATLDGAVSVVRAPTFRGNGMTLDHDLELLVCEHVSSSVARVRPDGVREVLAYHWRGTYLNSPNDVVVRSDGSIWFTDPWYGRIASHGLERPRALGWQGVFRLPPGAGPDDLRLAVAENEFRMPNGLCFSPDETLLYVNDTPRAHVKVFDVDPDGRLAAGRLFCEGVGTGSVGEGVVDGMKCDERGNVWVTGPGGIWVIGRDGVHLGVVEVPEIATNLAWGGPDLRTLFVTGAAGSVYTIRTLVGPALEPHLRHPSAAA